MGSLAPSIRSLLDPRGSWQVLHASRTGAGAHRNGRRFSAWQLTQVSLIQLPTRSIRTFVDPCGLWQDTQSIFPSLSGMWPDRCSLATSVLWHVTQTSIVVEALSCACCDLGVC